MFWLPTLTNIPYNDLEVLAKFYKSAGLKFSDNLEKTSKSIKKNKKHPNSTTKRKIITFLYFPLNLCVCACTCNILRELGS